MTAQMAPQSGQCLGERYRLVERIAVGGMGEVWRGVDEVLARQVAVKVLRTDLGSGDPFRQRFRTEARVAAMLSHPHIAQMYDYGETERSAYLIMELVPGEPLSTLITRHQTLGSDRTLGLMAQAARGLHAAHERGVVHRDVKPANVLVTPEGRVKITDFGIARPQDHANLTATGQVMGTAHYLAPEVARGATATALSDIYALGVVTYECLAGWRPFDGPNQVAVATAHLRQPPPPLPDTIGPDLRALVFQVLEKDPAKRPQTALALAELMESMRRRPRTASRPVVAAGGGAVTGSTAVLAALAGSTAVAAVSAERAAANGSAGANGAQGGSAGASGNGAAGTRGTGNGTAGAGALGAGALGGGAAFGARGAGAPSGTGVPPSGEGPDDEVSDDDEGRRRPLVLLVTGAALLVAALLGLWGLLGGGDSGGDQDLASTNQPSPTLTDPTGEATGPTETTTSPASTPTLSASVTNATSGPAKPGATPTPEVTVTLTPSRVVTTVVKVTNAPATTRGGGGVVTSPRRTRGQRPTTAASYKPGVEYIAIGQYEYTGQDAATAARILSDRGFPTVVQYANSSAYARGTVIRLGPSGTLEKGTTITLVVSGGR